MKIFYYWNRSRKRSQFPQTFPKVLLFRHLTILFIFASHHNLIAMYVTIVDIANALGLSTSTVSRALSGDSKNVSRETEKMVLEAAERMGYVRNELAVNLRKSRTMTVGVLVPELSTDFYNNFIAQIQPELQNLGYRIIVALSNEDERRERSNIGLLSDFRVDGILLSCCSNTANTDILSDLIRKKFPLVCFDRTIKGLGCSCVRSDDYKAAFFLMEHLIYSGRRHIAHFAGPGHIRNSEDRLHAYVNTLSKHGIPYDPALIVQHGLNPSDGAEEINFLLDQGITVDAVFCFNEMQAIGAADALQKRGFRIPEDVSVASMYGTTVSTLVKPAITSVEKPVEKMAKEAARIIVSRIENPDAPVEDVVIPSQMYIRESSDIVFKSV